jgi:hypothetical protein
MYSSKMSQEYILFSACERKQLLFWQFISQKVRETARFWSFSYISGSMGVYLTPLIPSTTNPCADTPPGNSPCTKQFLSRPRGLQLLLSEGAERPLQPQHDVNPLSLLMVPWEVLLLKLLLKILFEENLWENLTLKFFEQCIFTIFSNFEHLFHHISVKKKANLEFEAVVNYWDIRQELQVL